MRDALLLIHAGSGITLFILGILQAILPKRGKLHRFLGNCYVILWFPLIISGGYLGSWIILALGGLGLYSAVTGWRYAKSKKQLSSVLDKSIVLGGLIMVIILVSGSIYLWLKQSTDFAIIMSVFSIIFGNFIVVDIREILFGKSVRKRSANQMYWLFEHYGRMYISMIAAFSAFSAIQQPFSNQIINWLWPTIIGTIMLVILGRHYDKKFKTS